MRGERERVGFAAARPKIRSKCPEEEKKRERRRRRTVGDERANISVGKCGAAARIASLLGHKVESSMSFEEDVKIVRSS